jgi:DNA mismatch endonuclease (patch repair protein)
LPGVPDIVLPGRRVAIFVHGCFWHMHAGCRFSKLPATRPAFWKAKLEGNVARDKRAVETLADSGWRVLVVWECATRGKGTLGPLSEALTEWIGGGAVSGELLGASRGA